MLIWHVWTTEVTIWFSTWLLSHAGAAQVRRKLAMALVCNEPRGELLLTHLDQYQNSQRAVSDLVGHDLRTRHEGVSMLLREVVDKGLADGHCIPLRCSRHWSDASVRCAEGQAKQ